jgi:hypothetical protein
MSHLAISGTNGDDRRPVFKYRWTQRHNRLGIDVECPQAAWSMVGHCQGVSICSLNRTVRAWSCGRCGTQPVALRTASSICLKFFDSPTHRRIGVVGSTFHCCLQCHFVARRDLDSRRRNGSQLRCLRQNCHRHHYRHSQQ